MGYTSATNKYCSYQNDVYQSRKNEFKTAEECLQKCTADPKCVSAEWYGSSPTECDLSSTCTMDDVKDAPPSYGIVFYAKHGGEISPFDDGHDDVVVVHGR